MFRLKGPHIWWYFVVQVSIFGGKAEVLISQKPPPGWMFEIPKCHRPTDHVSVFLVHNMVDVMHYIIGIKSLYPHVLHDIIYMYIYIYRTTASLAHLFSTSSCVSLHITWCLVSNLSFGSTTKASTLWVQVPGPWELTPAQEGWAYSDQSVEKWWRYWAQGVGIHRENSYPMNTHWPTI